MFAVNAQRQYSAPSDSNRGGWLSSYKLVLSTDLDRIQPSFHEGSVSATTGDAGLIQYEAQTYDAVKTR